MTKITKALANQCIKQNQSCEQADPITFFLLGHEPEANEHTHLVDDIQPNESGYSVSLLFIDTQTPYTFYKKQLPATCRNSKVAKILANYAKSVARPTKCDNCTCENRKDLCLN